MFSHIMIGTNDMAASKRFYDATMAALGRSPGVYDELGRVIYGTLGGMLVITKPINGAAAFGANGGTVGFLAKSAEQIDAWHAAGVANDGTSCEEPPGPRRGHYLAYLRDPTGNKLCALLPL